jgi:hypothetical protein
VAPERWISSLVMTKLAGDHESCCRRLRQRFVALGDREDFHITQLLQAQIHVFLGLYCRTGQQGEQQAGEGGRFEKRGKWSRCSRQKIAQGDARLLLHGVFRCFESIRTLP